MTSLAARAEALCAEGASVMHSAVDAKLSGILAVSDRVKATTVDALATLSKANKRFIMVKDDGLIAALAVSKQLGIEEVHGEVKSANKLKLVEKPKAEGRIVAMASDGINDAPALTRADVGVSMGTGTDVAMNRARLTLVKGDLRGIPALSVATVANRKQNRRSLWSTTLSAFRSLRACFTRSLCGCFRP